MSSKSIVDYKVVAETYLPSLHTGVIYELNNGWQLYGNLQKIDGRYIQTLVKYSDPETPDDKDDYPAAPPMKKLKTSHEVDKEVLRISKQFSITEWPIMDKVIKDFVNMRSKQNPSGNSYCGPYQESICINGDNFTDKMKAHLETLGYAFSSWEDDQRDNTRWIHMWQGDRLRGKYNK